MLKKKADTRRRRPMKLNKGSSRRSPSGRKVLIRLSNDAELEEIDKIEKIDILWHE